MITGEATISAADIDKLPPGLREDIGQLKEEGVTASETPPEEVPKRRGRKPGSKNKPKEPIAPAPEIPDFPLESLGIVHREIWSVIAKRLRSDFKLSDAGEKEMAVWSNQVLKQYLGPYLAQHMALACYMMTQATALTLCIALRQPKQEAPETVGISADGI